MKAKKLLNVTLCVVILIITGCTNGDYKFVLDGYGNSEKYYDDYGSRDYTAYYKFYYTEEEDELFVKDSDYKQVKEEDIEVLKNYFQYFNSKNMADSSKYDFDIKCISETDYYVLKEEKNNDYNLYLYDMETHILYFIHDERIWSLPPFYKRPVKETSKI